LNPYNPPQTQPQAQPKSAAGSIKKDAAFYKAMQDAKKRTQNAVSELDFSNVNNAVKFLKEALVMLQPYETL